MRARAFAADGSPDGEVELPPVFMTPYRPDLIRKAYVNLASHAFQPQGRYPNAGMDVAADSNDPPTGRGVSRVARALGGGGGRQGQGAEVASTRGGRQAHPPIVGRRIHKKINRKEARLALCSAIAATASPDLVRSRGHRIDGIASLPLVISDDVESVARASELASVMGALNLGQDVDRLRSRKARSGRARIRGRPAKVGRSVLFVAGDASSLARAAGAIPGVEARDAAALSVLDLAPGSDPARLVAYTRSAIGQIAALRSTHLEVAAQ